MALPVNNPKPQRAKNHSKSKEDGTVGNEITSMSSTNTANQVSKGVPDVNIIQWLDINGLSHKILNPQFSF